MAANMICPRCKNPEPHLHRVTEGRDMVKLPVHDPAFNLQESCKQMLMLEQHLFVAGQRCRDCILKHLLTTEALLEEAVMLDKRQLYGVIVRPLIPQIRAARELFRSTQDFERVGQAVRAIRKPLVQFCYPWS